MYSITATLKTAAQAKWAKHHITAIVRDTAHRWTAVFWAGDSNILTDLAAATTAIVRCRRSSAATLQRQHITDPTIAAQWQSWSGTDTINANSDVAIAHLGANALHALAVLGTPTWQVRRILSTDGGQTWDPIANVGISDTTPAAPHIAAAGQYIAATKGTGISIYSYPSGGPLTLVTTALTITACYGLALLESAGVLTLAVAHDGILDIAQYTIATSTWSAWTTLAPGADAPGAPGSQPSWPSLTRDDDHIYLSYINIHGSAWTYPAVHRCRANNWPHFGEELPIYGNIGRQALTTFGGHAYIASHLQAMRRPINTSPAELELPTPHYYKRQADRGGGELTIHISNRAGRDGTGTYARPGEHGLPEAILRPVNQVTLSRGYVTAAGAETIALPPHYIISVAINDPTDGDMVIHTVDALSLLERWYPPTARLYLNRSLEYIARNITAQIGIKLTTTGVFTDTIPSVIWTPQTSAGAMLRQLLNLVGGVARVQQDGSIHCLHLFYHSPGPYNVGNLGETHQAAYASRLPRQTAARVFGSATAAAGLTNPDSSQHLGITLHTTREDWRIATQTMANDAAAALWHEANTIHQRIVTLPLRPEVELYDLLRLYARDALVNPSNRIHSVLAITEELTLAMPGTRYESTLTLAGTRQ